MDGARAHIREDPRPGGEAIRARQRFACRHFGGAQCGDKRRRHAPVREMDDGHSPFDSASAPRASDASHPVTSAPTRSERTSDTVSDAPLFIHQHAGRPERKHDAAAPSAAATGLRPGPHCVVGLAEPSAAVEERTGVYPLSRRSSRGSASTASISPTKPMSSPPVDADESSASPRPSLKAHGACARAIEPRDDLFVDASERTISAISAVSPVVTRWPFTNRLSIPMRIIVRVRAGPPPWTTSGRAPVRASATMSRPRPRRAHRPP